MRGTQGESQGHSQGGIGGHLSQQLLRSVDCWAVGIMLHELYCGERPFDGPTTEEIFEVNLPTSPCISLTTAEEIFGVVFLTVPPSALAN